jgi:glycosyltransferase involved in cell wall biosynthesis
MCGLAWRLAGAKTCIWNQRDEGIGIEPASRAARWSVRNTPAYVSNSQNTAAFLARAFGLPIERISIVHNGVELAPPVLDRIGWRQRLGVSHSTFVACMPANIHHNKDHATLLRAWRLVVDQIRPQREVVLILAGKLHPEGNHVTTLYSDLELGQSVRFLGPVDDIAGLLSAVNLGVFSSKAEGCPNGVLECMASGLPIVATDIPGIREAVGAAGLEDLAPPDDAVSFAQRILSFACNPDRAGSLGKTHRDRVGREFSSEQMVHNMARQISMAVNAKTIGNPFRNR